jgi:predicted nuclease of predicted toxin-antitoxin system
MRFKIDENLHDDVASLLTARGHDAETIHSEALRGCDDAVLADRCKNEQRALITLDLDFGDIRTYPPSLYDGLIVLRVADQSRSNILQVMERVIDALPHHPLEQRLWIVTNASIRIRGG